MLEGRDPYRQCAAAPTILLLLCPVLSIHTNKHTPLKQAAWSISVELLSTSVAPESASQIQYFSANTLYTKVRKHWHQLEAEHRDQIGAVILQVSLGNLHVARIFIVLLNIVKQFPQVPHVRCLMLTGVVPVT